jgi:hypothetical protein
MLCLCFQCMMQLGIVAWYNVNKDYVANVLCENKDKPELNCCGKCYVRKQIRKTEDQGTGKGPVYKLQKAEVFFLLPEKVTVATTVNSNTDKIADHYNFSIGEPAIKDIFHPPAC